MHWEHVAKHVAFVYSRVVSSLLALFKQNIESGRFMISCAGFDLIELDCAILNGKDI